MELKCGWKLRIFIGFAILIISSVRRIRSRSFSSTSPPPPPPPPRSFIKGYGVMIYFFFFSLLLLLFSFSTTMMMPWRYMVYGILKLNYIRDIVSFLFFFSFQQKKSDELYINWQNIWWDFNNCIHLKVWRRVLMCIVAKIKLYFNFDNNKINLNQFVAGTQTHNLTAPIFCVRGFLLR